VPEGQNGVVKEHPRAGKAHNFPDSRPHFRLVAMNPAIFAGRFLPSEGTFRKPLIDVGPQFLAGIAKRIAVVVCPAVNVDHGMDGFAFNFE